MYSLSLGPLALPVAPLFLIGSVWLGAWAAGRWAGRHPDPGQGIPPGERPGDELIHAAWWGLLWARLVHVGMNADLYLAQPLAMLDVRDGGWHAWSGWAAGLAWLFWKAWRRETWMSWWERTRCFRNMWPSMICASPLSTNSTASGYSSASS